MAEYSLVGTSNVWSIDIRSVVVSSAREKILGVVKNDGVSDREADTIAGGDQELSMETSEANF